MVFVVILGIVVIVVAAIFCTLALVLGDAHSGDQDEIGLDEAFIGTHIMWYD